MLLLKRKLFIVFGRSGTGKSTIVREFINRNPGLVKLIITTTTRPIRENEINGVNYYFKSKEEFEQLIAEDKLIEYTEYNGYYYGTTKDELDYMRDNMVILEPNGIAKIEELYKNTFIIFKIEIVSPDAKILERLLNRNSSVEEIGRRFRDDKVRFSNLNYILRIHNDFNLGEVVRYFSDVIKDSNNFL